MAAPPDDILDLLTAYALDALEPEEVARVGEYLERHPELRSTLAELRATVNQIPYALPDTEPPPDLRQRVLSYAVGRQASVAPQIQPAQQRSSGRGFRGWLAGLGGLAAASLIAAVIGWTQLAGANAALNSARAELERQVALNRQVAQVVVDSPVGVQLAGQRGAGTVFRSNDGQLVLSANLPALEQGRVYQLWLLEGSNAPLSGGTFTVDAQGYGVVALNEGASLTAEAFAVTEEPGPNGSEGPTTPILISNLPAS